MKALVLHAVGDLRYDDVQLPKRGSDEVTVSIKAAGICGSDVPRVFSKGTYHFPTVPGHEFSGIIADADNQHMIGKKVVVFPLVPCGICEFCKVGKYELCTNYDYYGSRRDGGFSEQLNVKISNLVFLPDDMDLSLAALAEPASVALHAIRQCGVQGLKSIAIWGLGPIGLLCAMWAKAFGARVIGIARDDKKIQFAHELGFYEIINSEHEDVVESIKAMTDGTGVDYCIEGTGASKPLGQALMACKAEGVVLTMGNPQGDIELSQQEYWAILRKQLQLRGTWNSSHNDYIDDWKSAIQGLYDNTIQGVPLITHRYQFSDYQVAFEKMRQRTEHVCKVMFIN